jgi:hypothetical protein
LPSIPSNTKERKRERGRERGEQREEEKKAQLMFSCKVKNLPKALEKIFARDTVDKRLINIKISSNPIIRTQTTFFFNGQYI